MTSLGLIAALFTAFAWWNLSACWKSHAGFWAAAIGIAVALATGAIWLTSPSRIGPAFVLPGPIDGMVFRAALIPAILGLVTVQVLGRLSLRHNNRERRLWPWR